MDGRVIHDPTVQDVQSAKTHHPSSFWKKLTCFLNYKFPFSISKEHLMIVVKPWQQLTIFYGKLKEIPNCFVPIYWFWGLRSLVVAKTICNLFSSFFFKNKKKTNKLARRAENVFDFLREQKSIFECSVALYLFKSEREREIAFACSLDIFYSGSSVLLGNYGVDTWLWLFYYAGMSFFVMDSVHCLPPCCAAWPLSMHSYPLTFRLLGTHTSRIRGCPKRMPIFTPVPCPLVVWHKICNPKRLCWWWCHQTINNSGCVQPTSP